MFTKFLPAAATLLLTAALSVVAVAAPASATVVQPSVVASAALSANGGFTVVTEGDVRFNSASETEGSWAVGGNLVQFGSKYTILAGSYQPTASLPVVETKATRLLVGGSVTLSGGTQEQLNVNPADGYGNVTIGSSTPVYRVNTSGEITDTANHYIKTGAPAVAANPYPTSSTAFSSFFGSSVFSDYRALSSSLATLSGTNVVNPVITPGPVNSTPLSSNDVGITLVANKINVWNVTSSQWSNLQGKTLKFYNSATIGTTTPLVINVPSSATSFNNPDFSGGPSDIAKYVLWNVPSTTTFELTGGKLFSGSVLAPNAQLLFNKSTPAEGQFVAKSASVTGNAEIHHYGFVPDITPEQKYEVAIYLYKKLDPTKPASWENSGKQTLIATHTGTDWFTTYPSALSDDVCGDGWGIQQDKVKDWSYAGSFTWPTNITYPKDNIGWPPIYDAKHADLSTLITVPACETPTGTPDVQSKTCVVGSKNWMTLPAVNGGIWEYEINGVKTRVASYDGAQPSGYGTYTIRLLDADANDKYVVTPLTSTWAATDPSTLMCAYAADPTWVDEVCNPTGPGVNTGTYTITPATGVGYILIVNDVLPGTDITPAGTSPVTYPVTTFPTKITIKAYALPGYTLVGTSELSHKFDSAGDCIDQDAQADLKTLPGDCVAAGKIDPASIVLKNASWTLPTLPGTYTVIATADAGHAFAGGSLTKSIPITIADKTNPTDPKCQLPTDALATPSYSSTPLTCIALGTYTIGATINGAHVKWAYASDPATVVPFGTYTVSATQTVTLLATSDDPVHYSLVDDNSDPWPNPTVLNFVKPDPSTCGPQLITLAYTGVATGGTLTLAGGLVFIGIGGLLVARRRWADSK